MYFWFFLSLAGRINRQEFLLGYFGLAIIDGLLIRILRKATAPAVVYLVGPDFHPTHDWTILATTLMVIWPLTAVFVKRLHDMNISGWWLLSVPTIATVASAINISPLIVPLLLVAALGVIKGKSGSNRFGPDPNESRSVGSS